MDLRGWIVTEHDGVRSRFVQSVRDVVPLERWKERPGDGGSSIAYLVFHTASHQDVALSSVIDGRAPLASSGQSDWVSTARPPTSASVRRRCSSSPTRSRSTISTRTPKP